MPTCATPVCGPNALVAGSRRLSQPSVGLTCRPNIGAGHHLGHRGRASRQRRRPHVSPVRRVRRRPAVSRWREQLSRLRDHASRSEEGVGRVENVGAEPVLRCKRLDLDKLGTTKLSSQALPAWVCPASCTRASCCAPRRPSSSLAASPRLRGFHDLGESLAQRRGVRHRSSARRGPAPLGAGPTPPPPPRTPLSSCTARRCAR